MGLVGKGSNHEGLAILSGWSVKETKCAASAGLRQCHWRRGAGEIYRNVADAVFEIYPRGVYIQTSGVIGAMPLRIAVPVRCVAACVIDVEFLMWFFGSDEAVHGLGVFNCSRGK